MLVYPSINLASDHPYWISRENFLNYFDQHDFNHYRNVKCVVQAYRRDWFCQTTNRIDFILPVATYVGDKTQFINGRHCLAVLLAALPELPIVLATRFMSTKQMQLISNIPKRVLDLKIPINIPDLPFLADSGTIERY